MVYIRPRPIKFWGAGPNGRAGKVLFGPVGNKLGPSKYGYLIDPLRARSMFATESRFQQSEVGLVQSDSDSESTRHAVRSRINSTVSVNNPWPHRPRRGARSNESMVQRVI